MGMDVYGKAHIRPEGAYFRASIWRWAPLCEFMEAAGFEVPGGWQFNAGKGLETQAECDALAQKLQEYLREHQEFSELLLASDLQVDKTGKLLPPGQKGESPYSVDREQIENWIRFLKACGGFIIR